MIGVSVIIPVFNEVERIDSLFSSLDKSLDARDEVILIDDFSTDESLSKINDNIVSRNTYTIKVIKNTSNRGVSYSRNQGIKLVENDYVIFLDSDDYLDANFKNILSNYMIKFDYPEIIRFNHSKANVIKHEPKVYSSFQQIDLNFINSYYLHSSCTQLVNKKLISSLEFNDSIMFGEDMLFNYNLLQLSGKILFVSDILYYYSYNDISASNRNDYDQIEKRVKSIIFVYNQILETSPLEFKKLYATKLANEISLQLFKFSLIDMDTYKLERTRYADIFRNEINFTKSIFGLHSILLKLGAKRSASILVRLYRKMKG